MLLVDVILCIYLVCLFRLLSTVPCWVYLLQKYPEKLLNLPYLSSYENSTTHPYIMRHRRTHKHPAQDDLSYEATN